MAFQLSPGVLVVEKDFTNIIPAVATTPGGYVGTFEWGPVMEVFVTGSEDQVLQYFGYPNDDTFVDFFTAANFLSYGNNLQIVRVVGAAAKNAVALGGTGHLIKNLVDYDTNAIDGQLTVGPWAAKYPGIKGNSLRVVCIDQTTSLADYNLATYDGVHLWSQLFVQPTTSQWVTDHTNLTNAADEMHMLVIDALGFWSGTIGTILETFPNVSKAVDAKRQDGTAAYYKTVMNNESSFIWWTGDLDTASGIGPVIDLVGGTGYHQLTTTATFDAAPAGGVTATASVTVALGVITAITITNSGAGYLTVPAITIVDTNGTPGSGASATAVLNNVQGPDNTAVLGSAMNTITATNLFQLLRQDSSTSGQSYTLAGGVSDEVSVDDSARELGWDLFQNAETYDVSLLPTGGASTILGEYVIQNIAEQRKDCVAFISPLLTDVKANAGMEQTSIVTTRNMFNSSSYAVMDSGWKYQYDKYNDTFRWVPLNGDIAGLCARTDMTNDPWWSPAGLNRGGILNVVKLAYSPDKTDRDILYVNGVNPVVTFPGNGTVLFGDKTMQAKPSAFDRINVRRLFIVLEKAIAKAAQYQLFEFNDAFTQAQFRNMVEPFLADVQGRRGIIDFRVICDSTNNTPEIIDSNQFIGDIYIKPARSINFITLNFIATATGVDFTLLGA